MGDVQPWFAIAGVVVGIFIGILTFNRNRDKDVRSDASELAVIRTTLTNISSGVDSIRVDIKANERQISEVASTVIRLDESLKTAHKRIDDLTKKGE